MADKIPDPKTVRKRRGVIEMGKGVEGERYTLEMKKWMELERELQSVCPHENMNGGSYSRWCTDCGRVWDTT